MVPIVAALLGIWMVVYTYMTEGPEISITFNTVKSFSRNCPTMVRNFVTCPFCKRKPKTTPLSKPRASFSGVSNIIAYLSV